MRWARTSRDAAYTLNYMGRVYKASGAGARRSITTGGRSPSLGRSVIASESL